MTARPGSGTQVDQASHPAPAPRGTPRGRPSGQPAAPRGGGSPAWPGPAWPLIAVPAVTLALMMWGITAPAYWGDEADTVSAVSRSLPQLLSMLRHVDAVHGLYYLALWPVAKVLGTGELATRLPSALAMAAAALGVAAIARRLVSTRAAWCAGLLVAAYPVVSAQAHDARPYGMVTAAAVLASYLLIRALEDPRWGWFAAYGGALALLGYLELFGLLLIPAHAVTMAGFYRRGGRARSMRRPGRWLVTVMLAVAAVLPVVALGWQQRAQIGWIAKPTWHDALDAVVSLGAGSVALAVVIGLLTVAGVRPGAARAAAGRARPRRAGPTRAGPGSHAEAAQPTVWPWASAAGRPVTWLALPWLALPPALLLLASEVQPAYNFRYLVFCLPAVALLAGAGMAALGTATRVIALALVVALAAPAQVSIRTPGTGMRTVAGFLAARARPDDAVIYPGEGVPPWYLAYPDPLGRMHDIWMAGSGPATGRLYGVRVTGPVLLQRERTVCRIWAVDLVPPWPDPATDIGTAFHLVGRWQPQPGVWLWLYQRPGCTQPPGTAP